ncbi:elongation factor 1-beta [Candidatus Micrarchaeota archaeon CG11_big_fil_rev_8_21_14_0_20_47_5]|nr:MAG: hypothetical protein AUJ17_04170 [Candidatus Micrarchaeota archaeon CG1_02_47_40]PIN83731.1 MAG: elongation factor 1-beta [Candidatus Micrarchaeota archaeon CG11_big_fil_rev_8_21_14_0_20_47_5]QBM01433.1 elongation factor 1-beta [uncultured archaeon]
MGEVAVKLKIYPEGMEEFEELKVKVKTELNANKIEEEEIAFGMKAIIATVIVGDSAGGSDALEEKASKIAGVSQVQVESVDRL